MSNNVARKVTPQLWHKANNYRGQMVTVRKLLASDVDAVVSRIVQKITNDASVKELINPDFSREHLSNALESSRALTWVAYRDEQLVGHIYGALLDNETYGSSAWIGPDGVSFDDGDVLDALYAVAGQDWINEGASEHYVWTLDDSAAMSAWFNLAFAKMHSRGVMKLREGSHGLDERYRLRQGTLDDLDVAIFLDDELELAQTEGPSFSLGLSKTSQRDEWIETLSDPDTRHYVLEFQGDAVGQCVTFPLPEQRSSFDATTHLSAVVILPQHRSRGLALAMVDSALNDARERGFLYAATNWRVTNRRAAHFWTAYGFEPTYVRLHRTIGTF
jgi:ribosomal protein S18 acetylase RimI-like enzyme